MSNEIVRSAAHVALGARTPEQWDAVRKMFCPPAMSDAEFGIFVSWCRHTGLDPTLGHAYCVPRKSADKNGNWSEKWSPMATEAGVTALVDAQPDCRGFRGGCVYEGDEFSVDEASGEVLHRWSPAKRNKNKLLFAWCQVLRAGRSTPISILELGQRLQTKRDGQPMARWSFDAAGMLLKCARAEAARRAYPSILAGTYTEDEMPEEFQNRALESSTSTTATLPAPTGVARLAAAISTPAVASPPRMVQPVLVAAPAGNIRGAVADAMAAVEAAAEKRAAEHDAAPLVGFGPRAKERLDSLSDDDLASYLHAAAERERAAADDVKPKWREKITQAKEIADSRVAVRFAEPPPPSDEPPPIDEATELQHSPPSGPTFPNYGKAKGQAVYGAKMKDLELYAQGCRRSLADQGKERWHPKERALLAAIEAEIQRQGGSYTREPGSEG